MLNSNNNTLKSLIKNGMTLLSKSKAMGNLKRYDYSNRHVNWIDDISNNATMQNILKEKLNDSSITQGEYNRIMDALDNGKLDDSYFQTINNGATGYSLDNSNNIGNSASV